MPAKYRHYPGKPSLLRWMSTKIFYSPTVSSTIQVTLPVIFPLPHVLNQQICVCDSRLNAALHLHLRVETKKLK